MIRVYDFVCEDGHRTEHFIRQDNTDAVPCHCGKPSHRAPSAPPCILDGASGHFPGRAMRWEREHEKAGRGSHTQD